MKSITLKDIPEDLHAQLKREAEVNFRSMNQEVLARIQRSFDLDDRYTAAQVNRLIQEAVESGPELPLTAETLESARTAARAQFASKGRT
jgi:hypothetical protein